MIETDREASPVPPGIVAMGAYVRRLRRYARERTGHDMTLTQAAAFAETNEQQISRIELGQIHTRVRLMLRLCHVVHGIPDHLLQLCLMDSPSPDDGTALAEIRIAQLQGQSKGEAPARLRGLLAAIEHDAHSDPELIAALEGWLAGRRSSPGRR